ncbi:MAG: hypothetical protein JWM86_1934 [Thermoleophilia bacterium]|nr:hypothetical protein [Thermoleophilia bacterium]
MSSRSRKFIAFIPAMVVMGVVAITASGLSIIPGAGAASTLSVTGNVTAGMSISPDTASACGGGSTVPIGDFSAGTPIVAGTGCTVTFATNSVNGANVTIDDVDAAPFFCTGACTAASNLSVENVAAAAGGSALGDDNFGVALTAVAGTPAPVAGTNFTVDATPTAAESIWAPVAAAPSNFCQTSAVTTATQSCSIRFAADGQGATQTAGSYAGTANVLATANP